MDVAIVENVKATKERRTFGVEITRAWHLLIESEDIEEGKKPLIIGRTIRESISSGATIIRVLNDGEVWERMEVTDQGHFDSVLPDHVGRHLAGFPQTSKSELADPDLLELNDDAILEILVDELGSSNVLRYRRPTGPHAMKVAAPIDYLLFRAG